MFVNRALRTIAVVFVAAVPSVLGQRLCAEDAPRFVVEPFWPKPLPDNWILGQVAGAAVDSSDHVWVIHRPLTLLDDEKGAMEVPPATKCCSPAPPVLEFDSDGNLLRSWGGPVRTTIGRRTNMASLSITIATSGSPATTPPTIRSSSSHPMATSSSRLAKQA